MKHYSIRVYGKVQGVFFRASAREKAQELGINGRIRNEADGSVSAEAEGPEDHLQDFISWCRQGPPRASVDKVEYSEGESKGYQDFEVVR
jgi:acylphosphatase